MWTSSTFFLTFDQSFLSFSTFHEVICYKFCKAGSGSRFKKLLDPDLRWDEQLDPDLDPQKMNANPQPWWQLTVVVDYVASTGFFGGLSLTAKEHVFQHLKTEGYVRLTFCVGYYFAIQFLKGRVFWENKMALTSFDTVPLIKENLSTLQRGYSVPIS